MTHQPNSEESLRRQLGLCNIDQANAEAENAALREWESCCAVALGVPGCAPEEMLHVIDNQREDAERWNVLPAFLEKYQLDYVGLKRDIDAAIDEARKK
tara:strand:- start:482 stop:778 length:297 start_codon:yes stop_codon:yes gene_type:complete